MITWLKEILNKSPEEIREIIKLTWEYKE